MLGIDFHRETAESVPTFLPFSKQPEFSIKYAQSPWPDFQISVPDFFKKKKNFWKPWGFSKLPNISLILNDDYINNGLQVWPMNIDEIYWANDAEIHHKILLPGTFKGTDRSIWTTGMCSTPGLSWYLWRKQKERNLAIMYRHSSQTDACKHLKVTILFPQISLAYLLWRWRTFNVEWIVCLLLFPNFSTL